MCGICGVVGKKVEKDIAIKCINTLEHRGPDGMGIYLEDDVMLAHRRLSILDLSDNGKQPMSYANERYWMTYNGEIYNFLELKVELSRKGYSFNSDSDTEVLLAAFVEWKEECLNKLNGMWAFAVWDKYEKKLFLCRDRFGVKPLFYTFLENGSIAFASEMKALLPLMASVEADESVFELFNHGQHYEMQEKCLIKGIKRFPAGHFGWYHKGCLNIRQWWHTLDHLIKVPQDYSDQVEMFKELFLDACRIRMRSDVTIGTALSGGLDSSATICAMARLAQNSGDMRMNDNWQHAFVATFPGTGLDETVYAKQVTDYLGIESTYSPIGFEVSENEFLRQIYLFEELWNNPQVPMMQIYGKEREQGVLVSIDGHGADELFGGYDGDVLFAYLDAGLQKKSICEVGKAYIDFKMDSTQMSELEFNKLCRSNYFNFVLKYHLRKLLNYHYWHSGSEKHPQWNKLDNLNHQLYIETHERILPTLLRNYDRDSMANGVEIRMPFMDYRIVSFAFSIGWNSKIRNGYTKSVIRDAIKDFVPSNIVWRKNKIGFCAPLLDWMKGNGREFFEDTLLSKEFKECGLITNSTYVVEKFKDLLGCEQASLLDAMDVWVLMQPFFWEKAMIKQNWKL